MRRLNVVVLLLLFSLCCIGASGEQESGNSEGDHSVSLAFENFVTRGDGVEPINCGAAVLQGLRPRQEDRILCMVDIPLPRFGEMPDTKVSLYAVFDGHGGDEASHLASQNLHKRFIYHLYNRVQPSLSASHSTQAQGLPSVGANENPGIRIHESNMTINSSTSNASRNNASGEVFVHSAVGVILKEALAEAISDVESSFAVEAKEKGLQAGSTACIVLQVDDHLLVANLGDSKALLCPAAACSAPPDATSESLDTRRREILERRSKRKSKKSAIFGACDYGSSTVELTRDHRPNREDEKLRIEAAGGFVVDYGGLSRVNGQVAVSRSLGDLALKEFGVTAEPEWTGWLKVGSNTSHLVIASDGIFEKLTTREVCSVVSAVLSGTDVSVALGLPQVTELPIALLPRNPVLEEKQNSRAIVPIPEGNIGSASLHLVNTAQQMNSVQTEDTKDVDIPDPLAEFLLGNLEPELQVEVRDIGVRDVGVGSEAVPHTPENLARVFAKAIVDAAFRSGSRDNLATIVVPLHTSTRRDHDSISHGKHNEDHAARRMSEADRESTSTLIDMSRDLQSGELEKDESLFISGMLVKGIGGGDCYELIDTVLGSSILPWRPVVEFTYTENSNEAVVPVVERLPPSSHRGVAGGQLEIYREHLICTPKVTAEGNVKEVCLPPEGLARFINLIGSIPLQKQRLMPEHWDSKGRSRGSKSVPPYSIYHQRYMLQKNFARGAFGEIWLAVKRPCLKEDIGKKEFYSIHVKESLQTNSSESERTGYIRNGKDSSKYRRNGGWSSGHFGQGDTYILKRIMVEKGGNAYFSGLREKHFGEVFLNETQVPRKSDQGFSSSDRSTNRKGSYWTGSWSPKKVLEFFNFANASSQTEEPNSGLDYVSRYVESFEWPGKELWLVFHYEGKSLSGLLYNAGMDAEDTRDLKGFKVVQPSPWWRWLKTTEDGRLEMRSIIHQLLLAVKACHDRNITHRDIKPENMVVSTDRVSDWPSNLTLRIIDFGSAIDRYSLRHLYNPSGPSQAEQTVEYAPPEATLSQHWLYFHPDQAHVYDMWSVGIVMLELVLGTPHVFQISSRTRVLLDQQLEGMDEAAKNTIYLLRAYLEMCILLPGIPPQHHHRHQSGTVEQSEEVRLAAWKCTEESVMQQIKQRDPLGIGMPDMWALRLLRELLQWYPEDRISVYEALKHPYFHPSLQH